MKVAIVSGPRSAQGMGLESAELQLLRALRENLDGLRLDLRVVGGRAARRHARSVGGRWYPGLPGRLPPRAWRSADLLHLVGLDVPPPPRGRFVAMVHDLAALRFPDEGALPPWAPEIIARAARVLTPSRFTAGELQELFDVAPERIRVVPNGPGQPVSPATEPLSEDELRALGLSTPFVLRMGGYTQRKNVPVLLDAWPEVRRRTGASLALAGPPQPARDAQLAAAPSLDGVAVLHYLPAAVVPRLLRSASALVSTSTYEGFGLPPLEAMAAGVPVVAVRSGAVEEVCGDAALLVDNDPRALADVLIRALEDESLGERLRSAGLARSSSFTWEKAGESLRDIYRECASARDRREKSGGNAGCE